MVSIKNNEIFHANKFKLGYLNEKAQLKNDEFMKIIPENQCLDIETNKNKSARLNCNEFISKQTNKKVVNLDFLKLENDEHLINCFKIEKFLD